VKKIIFAAFILLFCVTAVAQDISLKKDVINVGGKPYAKLLKKGSVVHNFSVQTLDGKEILLARYNQSSQDYTIIFAESGNEGRMPGNFNFSKILAKEVVANHLIKDNILDKSGEKRFLQMHPAGGNAPTPRVNTPAQEERNRTQPVMIFGNNISQDNLTIGTYTSATASIQGKVVKTVSIKDADGNKIAEATMDGISAKNARVITLKDNKTTTIFLNAQDDMSIVKQVAEVLVSNFYL
jgi:hypothetical protein